MSTNRLPLVGLVLVAILTIAGCSSRDKPEAPDFGPVVQGNNAFAFDLYAKLRTGHEGNLFFSPYSISAALAMTYAGASGNTAAEMAKTLHFSLPHNQLHPAFATLASKLQGDAEKRGYQLRIANRLWGPTGYTFLPKFLQITRDDYGAELAQVDFARTEDARQTINTWVKDKTEKEVRELVAPGVLSPETRLVLVNAICFKSNWHKQFNAKATIDAPFYITKDKQFAVPMMRQTENVPYGADDGVQILELPYLNYRGLYAGRDASMVIVLPDAIDGLGNLEKRLTPEKLGGWMAALREREVWVSLPRFKVVSDFRLDAALQSMGMPLPFSPNADFAGMDGKHDLYLAAVLHKAFVAVDEHGTEATAATAEPIELSADGETPAVFRADHPFLFLIRDNRTGSILFLGRVVNPKE